MTITDGLCAQHEARGCRGEVRKVEDSVGRPRDQFGGRESTSCQMKRLVEIMDEKYEQMIR